jgi:hypothetical protein
MRYSVQVVRTTDYMVVIDADSKDAAVDRIERMTVMELDEYKRASEELTIEEIKTLQ